MLRVIVNNSRALVAAVPFPPGALIRQLVGQENDTPTRTSIQVGNGRHIEDDFGSFVNHSCDPSAIIENGCLVALKQIDVGNEITFDYKKNEDILASPFLCWDCKKMITGKTTMCQK